MSYHILHFVRMVKEYLLRLLEILNKWQIIFYTYWKMILTEEYSPDKYPQYDDYEAIEVGKTKLIPYDYAGVMGVPITFLQKYNPQQFEIVGLDRYVEDNPHYGHRFTINGKETFARILIRNLNPQKTETL